MSPRRGGDEIGRHFVLPIHLRIALAQIFDVPLEAVDRVRVVEHSRFARLHGPRVAATTRRNAIHLSGSGDALVGDDELVLHEYFHVLGQWNAGTLTVWRYLRESMRNGYRRNRFEVEACAFAREHRFEFGAQQKVAARGLARGCYSSDVRSTDERKSIHLPIPANVDLDSGPRRSGPTSKEKS